MSDGILKFEDLDYVGKEVVKDLEKQAAAKEQVLETNQEAKLTTPVEANDKYQSINLPSNFIFYDFDTIKVRKFEIRDLAKMHRVMQNESIPMFKEVIQGCVDKNINLLTAGDFKYICYWLRLNSYPKSPMTVEWRSKYGNESVAQVRKTDLTVLAPEITKEDLEAYRSKGFEVPTLEFSSIFDGDISDDDDFLYSNAQFFKGKTWEEKIQNLENYTNENGLESLQDVKQFDDLIDHGVKEELVVYDPKFDPEVYKKTLEEKIQKLQSRMTIVEPGTTEESMIGLLLDTNEKELAQLVKKLENKEVIQADPETIFLEMDAIEFFSPLLSLQYKR